MAIKNSFYSISVYLFLGLLSVSCSVYGAQQQPNRQHDQDVEDGGLRDLERLINRSTEISKPLQRIKELRAIPGAVGQIDDQIRALDIRRRDLTDKEAEPIIQQINAWKEAKLDLLDILKADSKYGKAIAFGLSGNDSKMLQGIRVESVAEGVKLGTSIRISRACSDVLGKRIENSIDRVLGGTWDTIISAIVDSWNAMWEAVFHGSGEPFTMKQIKGWQDLIKASFEDIGRLLKDGLKDSLRGHDMTLRQVQADDEVVEEAEEVINAWHILVNGYVRQFDYVVRQLDKHLIYYNGDEMVGFYVEEIKRQLLETNKLLTHGSTLKELDALLDSNKTLIPALQKNILNLFTRLLDLIEPPASSSRSANSSSASSDSSRKSSMGRSGYDDEGVPRSFRY